MLLICNASTKLALEQSDSGPIDTFIPFNDFAIEVQQLRSYIPVNPLQDNRHLEFDQRFTMICNTVLHCTGT